MLCIECGGSGEIDLDEGGIEICPICDGSGSDPHDQSDSE